MTRRSGLTLVEVLTALFILALGVISILTLFPMGALQMAQAIRDNRSTESAFNADQFMRTIWKTNVVEPPTPTEPFYYAMNDPDDGATIFTTPPTSGPSYPVAVDPMGFVARQDTAQRWVGDTQTNVPRRTLSSVSTQQHALKLCSLMDTMGFEEGVPNGDRELRYNWLWVLQRPNVADRNTADMTVVVFDRRAHLHATLGAEDVLTATATPTASSVTFPATNAQTKIIPGTWIMDGTVYNPNAPAIGRPGIRHANFYRVTAVVRNADDSLSVELQTPIKTPSDNGGAYTATFVVWRGVSGVYVRTPLKPQN